MYQKKFVRILLFFYLFGSFASATHIHHDALESHHADCKVCLMVNNLHGADVPSSYTLVCALPSQLPVLTLQNTYYTSQIIKGYNAHAPPAFS